MRVQQLRTLMTTTPPPHPVNQPRIIPFVETVLKPSFLAHLRTVVEYFEQHPPAARRPGD